ncbi:GntR family transcriptional regulator [Paracoccus aestuarii]|uniref:GntR family transcriptional regulator n=1 Tax=Paracoccus aestuarii TaxID=453842 RepID=A0A419A2U1_9RHOB|nr:GntR family transcriptional regulator [Paracoccus aestuarii]RJL07548.1 GntR family transcriptional regulator [Paracoccus aestuarii]WCQ99033.1 GntR family transcriptional regulator [Paracoccus aestuarii]
MTDSTRADALPLHMQISELMIRDIAAGRLVDGQRLPPERQLAEAHGTTVRTLRKALAVLELQGLLERRQGSGNYVRAGGQPVSVYSMFRLEHAQGGGGLPNARILSVDLTDKDAGQPDYGTSAQGTRFRRLRFLDRTPIAVEEIWLDAGAGAIPRDQVQDSLYLTYKRSLKLWITRAEDRVGLGVVPDWAPEAFAPRPGATCAYIERLSWAQGPRAVEFSRTWYDHERALYVQRLI